MCVFVCRKLRPKRPNRTTWHLPGTVTGPDHALPTMEHVMFPEELETGTIRGPRRGDDDAMSTVKGSKGLGVGCGCKFFPFLTG